MSVWEMPWFQSKFIHFSHSSQEFWMLNVIKRFKAIAGLVKETKETTGEALSVLCKF